MTDKEINEAIAGVLGITQGTPDFTGDLNEIHEAENTLPYNMNGPEFADLLLKIVSRDHDPACVFSRGSFAHVHASARQRAEAFLRVLNKWEVK